MADFFQNGIVATLSKLKSDNLVTLERELKEFSKRNPVTLILPSLYMEFEGTALPRILKEIKRIPYLHEIVFSLDHANKEQYIKVKEMLSEMPQKVTVLWNDGKRLKKLSELLEKRVELPKVKGKGKGVWMALGYVLAKGESYMVTTHDCDILTYNRLFLARLIYPVMNPHLSYEFCKGYYARASDKLYGRVMRLFYTPLIKALRNIFKGSLLLEYLNSFRYALSGEFSMVVELAGALRVPADWGLEVGILGEVYSLVAPNRVCQTELVDLYDHKHRPLSKNDASKGLMRMAIDIARTLYRLLAQYGLILNEELFRTIKVAYWKEAREALDMHQSVALINSLSYDRHKEAIVVETFVKAVDIAVKEYMDHPMGNPLIPNWSRVAAAIPSFFDDLLDVVDKDNREKK